MKGIVFTEFLEMVSTSFSEDMVDDILEDAQPASGGAYTAVGTYPHQEIVAMVGALSKRSGVPVPDLVHAFGTYLFGRFHVLYPGFFEGVGDALEFLERIESVVHAEVLKLYPDAELPRFETSRDGADVLQMIYRSPRRMGDLAAGLIEGCVAHYGGGVTVARRAIGDGVDEFILRRQA